MTNLNDAIRAHLREPKAHFASVEFIKRDNTVRRLTFQNAAMPSRVKGTARGVRASLTRARNHPNLVTVWAVHERGWRTVNLDTVLCVRARGKTVQYRRLPCYGVALCVRAA